MEKEIWKPVNGYEELYEVSSLGRVISRNYRRTGNRQELGQWISAYGYKIVHLTNGGKTRTVGVHRLVARAFIPNPNNKKEVNHKDGNKENNVVKNLEWVSRNENQRHKYRILGYPPVRARCKPVANITTGEQFDSVRAAARAYKTAHSNIARAIERGIRCKGCYWTNGSGYGLISGDTIKFAE